MSVIRIDADMRDLEGVVKRLGQPLDMRNAKAPLVAFYVEREVRQFERSPWRRLSRRYAKQKAKDAPGQGILRRTGALFAGLTTPEVVEFTPEQGVIGVRTGQGRSPLFYAQFAQEGRGEPKRTLMPALKRSERDEITDIIRVSVLKRALHARS